MGWALANVWYDKHQGPPPQNSPLESLFMIVKLRRMEAELLSTRALVHASMLTPDGKVDPVVKAFQEFADKAMPFLAGAQDHDKQKERDTLIAFTKLKARVNMKTVYEKQGQELRKPTAAPKNFKLRPRMPGL